MYELMIRRSFAAAHQLRGYRGKCEALHGHNWVVEAFVKASDLDSIGLALDFGQLKKTLDQILETLDHKFLNDMPPFQVLNPSCEYISRHIYESLDHSLAGGPARVSRVRVWESADACVTYTGGEPG